MKKNVYGFFFIALACLIAAFFATCDLFEDDDTNQTQTPVAADYTFGKLSQTAGSVTPVSITAKEGKSPGATTIYYQSATYTKNTTPPQAAGTYAVTFDVAQASGWNKAEGLSAGDLVVTADTGNQTPVAGDYTFGWLTQKAQTAESVVRAVLILPKNNKSPGAITTHYEGAPGTTYVKSTNVPQTVGNYTVTFDVAAATGWNAAAGLSAGTLNIITSNAADGTPTETDFTIGRLQQKADEVTAVTITPKEGKSTGATTIFYQSATYTKSTTPPQAAGTYAVTFDVDAAPNWKMAIGLSAGNLTVTTEEDNSRTPVRDDYDISNLNQTAGSVTTVTITAKTGVGVSVSSGSRTIYYEGAPGTTYAKSTSVPQTVGTYKVTFDVAAVAATTTTGTRWNAASGLIAGTLTVNAAGNQTPTASHYTSTTTQTTSGSNITVTVNITRRTDITTSTGTVSNIKYGDSATAPTTNGDLTVAVTFDVAAAEGWSQATGLSAGTLKITTTGGNFTVSLDSASSSTATSWFAATGWFAASDLSAGTLNISAAATGNQIPAAGYFAFNNLTQTTESHAITLAATGWEAEPLLLKKKKTIG